MSSLQKFENKFISYQTSDLVNSYIVNATKELKKIHKSCNFDESVKIIKDRQLIMVSLVGRKFKLSIRHGEQTHNTKIKIFHNNVFIKEIPISAIHKKAFFDYLISLEK